MNSAPTNDPSSGDLPASGPDEPHALLARLSECRVTVFGDLMLDRFVEGEVERLSPEGPIPVLRARCSQIMLGGAGNVARNVASLGGWADLVGLVGADGPGRDLARLAGAEPRLIWRAVPDPGRRTTVKTRFLAQSQHVLRVDEEDAHVVAGAPARALLTSLEAALPGVGALVLSDYAKGALTPDTVAAALALARRHGARTIVDPKSPDLACYAGVDVLTPNAAEASMATGLPCRNDAEAAGVGRAIAARTGAAVVLTRGAAGLTVIEAGGTVLHLPTRPQDVFDVSGAGDTIVAVLALTLAAGVPLAEAARLANRAARIVVGRVGTAAVTAAELGAALDDARGDEGTAGTGKVVDRATAAARVAAWHRVGRRVAFTNGCFDLLHPGHLATLRFAAAAGDRLVVGLNTDASVARLKGPGRPVQRQAARAAMLAALDFVDLVVPYDTDTPLALIAALQPDALIKGADYTLESVVGADLVRGWGGRVLLAPLLAGHSTTGLVARLAAGRATEAGSDA